MRTSIAPPVILLGFLLGTLCGCDGADAQDRDREVSLVERATAVLVPVGDSGVEGTVKLEQTADGVHVTGRITGLTPGLHGFHVHEYGDLSNRETGKSAGGHFAPRGHAHGRPTDDVRHVGDLGNIEANAEGVAVIDLVDDTIRLNGPFSILGRALVVHSGEDKFTQPSGDAGDRVAFGVIGTAQPQQGS